MRQAAAAKVNPTVKESLQTCRLLSVYNLSLPSDTETRINVLLSLSSITSQTQDSKDAAAEVDSLIDEWLLAPDSEENEDPTSEHDYETPGHIICIVHHVGGYSAQKALKTIKCADCEKNIVDGHSKSRTE